MPLFQKKLAKIFNPAAPQETGPAANIVLEVGNDETELLEKVKPYTFCEEQKLSNLRKLASQLRYNGVTGDIVECGTYRGGSSAVLGTTLSAQQHLWLYDSFQGMPKESSKDGPDAGQYAGKGIAAEEDVMKILSIVNVPREQYTIRKGWFSETFQQPLPEKVAFLHCDADWYEAVLLILETFYPRMSEGSCIVLDDFGYWEGCREAFYTFCCRHNVRPLLERRSIDQAYWFKGKTHNRS